MPRGASVGSASEAGRSRSRRPRDGSAGARGRRAAAVRRAVRRPGVSVAGEPAGEPRHRAGRRRFRHPHDRHVVGDCPAAPAPPQRPVRTRVPVRRSRRPRAERRPAPHRGAADDLGHALLGEWRRRRECRSDPSLRSRGLRARAGRALLGQLCRVSAGSLLLDLERAELVVVPETAVQLARPAGRSARLRVARPGGVRRDQTG